MSTTSSGTSSGVDAPVRDFNHHSDPAVRVDPFTAFDRFRDERVFWTEELDGFWVLTRHADIRAVLRDTDAFSSRHTSIPPAGWPRPLMPVELDPPDHNRYRALLARCLNGAAGSTITRALETASARLVERLAPAGECDLVLDFARPLQNALFAALFDVPEEETQACSRWADDLLQDVDPGRRARATTEFMAYVGRAIGEYETGVRGGDGTGLLDVLASAEVDGEPLSREQALDLAFLMGMASLDTLTNSVSFTFRYLAAHPEHQHRLAAEPGIAASAAEELLRLHSVVSIARTATRDTEVAGVRLRAGDRVLLNLSLAGRDPHHYPDPASADFDRANSASHVAFGFGAHRCLGARIATQGLAAALRDWHTSIVDYSVGPGAELAMDGGAVCSLENLPLVWRS
ncbi:cytochrome P450 [Actinophytocola xinjiangensis]|uniref:cytochrome P450 n=1 Tax=Actinophytocola xinjiangensis TaxID=485602 RepID=UPI000A430ED7|nr:cytochrome P450 [Actinophytocola xinjiangensis]